MAREPYSFVKKEDDIVIPVRTPYGTIVYVTEKAFVKLYQERGFLLIKDEKEEKETIKEEEAKKKVDIPTAEELSKLNKGEIIAKLEELGIEYKKEDTKAELIGRFEG